jgi:hypothetical protein
MKLQTTHSQPELRLIVDRRGTPRAYLGVRPVPLRLVWRRPDGSARFCPYLLGDDERGSSVGTPKSAKRQGVRPEGRLGPAMANSSAPGRFPSLVERVTQWIQRRRR